MTENLYIDGQQVDIPTGGVGVSLNLRTNIFSDIGSVEGNYTNTIKIPKTARNMAVFEVPDIVANLSDFPYTYHAAKYVRNGIEIIEDGKAVLLKVTEKELEITIVWGVIQGLLDLKGRKINELSGTERATLTEQPTPTAAGATPSVLWAAYNSSFIASNNKPTIPVALPFMPSLSVASILARISTDHSIVFDYGNIDLTKLLVPIVTRKGDEDTYGGNIIGSFSNTSGFTGRPDMVITTYDSAVLYYTGWPNLSSYVTFKTREDTDIIISGWISQLVLSDTATLATMQQALAGKRMSLWRYVDAQTKEHIAYISPEGSSPVVEQLADYSGHKMFSVTFTLNGTASIVKTNNYEFYIDVPSMTNDNPHCWVYGTTLSEQNTDGRFTLRAITPNATPFGYSIPMYPNLPSVEISALLKALNTLYGLFPVVVDKTRIAMHSVDDLSANISNARNWTRYIITGDEKTYRVSNFAQRNILSWQEDDTVMGDYNGVMPVQNETLDYEKDMYTMPFAAADGYGIPSWKREDGELEYTEPKPKIMRRVDDDTYTFAQFTGLSLADAVENRYGTLRQILSRAKVVKVKAALPDIEVRNFSPVLPVYIAQYGLYFAVLEIASKGGGIYELSLIKI